MNNVDCGKFDSAVARCLTNRIVVSSWRATAIFFALILSMFLPNLLLGKSILLVAVWALSGGYNISPEQYFVKVNLAKYFNWKYLWFIPLIFSGTAFIQFFWQLILTYCHIQVPPQMALEYLSSLSGTAVWQVLLAMIVLAPVTEELIFRHFLFGAFAAKIGGVGSVIMVSILFAAVHWQYALLPGLFFMAICWQLIYIKTGNLLTVTGLHFCNNLFTIGLFYFLSK